MLTIYYHLAALLLRCTRTSGTMTTSSRRSPTSVFRTWTQPSFGTQRGTSRGGVRSSLPFGIGPLANSFAEAACSAPPNVLPRQHLINALAVYPELEVLYLGVA